MKLPFPSKETLEGLRPPCQLQRKLVMGRGPPCTGATRPAGCQGGVRCCACCPAVSGTPSLLPSLNMLLPHRGLSLWKRNPSTQGGEAVISSFIFQFPFRSSSTPHAPGHPRGAEGGKKRVPASTCSLGLPEGGDWPNPLYKGLLKFRCLAPLSPRWEVGPFSGSAVAWGPHEAVTASETIGTARPE